VSTNPAVSVVAVVVTFNRKELLQECLAALFAQTAPLSRIIVVDNASTDGTRALIESSNFAKRPAFQYVQMETNTGGAGGFQAGMELALKYGADWIWVMDDDVAAEPTALEELLRYKGLSECIHPSRTLPDGSAFEWEQIFDPATTARCHLHDVSFKNGKEFCVVTVACFEGMLISANLTRKIGVPRGEYFIGDDDTLYGFKASLHTNVLYIRSARLRKLLAPPTQMTAFKAYFAVRNKLWMHKEIRRLGVLDNSVHLRFRIYYPFYVLRLILSNFRAATLTAVFRGIRDGMSAPGH